MQSKTIRKKLLKETFGNYNLSLSAERHATHSVRSKYFAVDNRTSTIITNNGEKLNSFEDLEQILKFQWFFIN